MAGSQLPGMEGFAREFVDPEHYIIDITWRIWEGRGIELIRQWYSPDCIVRSPHRVTNTVEAVVEGTYATLSEFPDRQLLPEEIIIGLKNPGFYSSHRVRSTATYSGDGAFGPAIKREIGMLTIADCLCRDNRIVEEWLVRDQASMAIQLGLDPVALGLSKGERSPGTYAIGTAAYLERWSDPAGLTIVGDRTIANRAIDAMASVWSDRKTDRLAGYRDRSLRFEGPSGMLVYGHERFGRAVGGILDSLPDGLFAAHHVIVREDEDRPVRIAMRWSFTGTHTGRGAYGEAKGCPLSILAISHFELRHGMILNEWMLADDLAVWAQIGAHEQK